MKYSIVRTDTADMQLRNIVLYVAENFGTEIALKRLDELEDSIMKLQEYQDLGVSPAYPTLRRQGYKMLILEKDLVFYKVDEKRKRVIIYAVVDQRQDYLNIIRGL